MKEDQKVSYSMDGAAEAAALSRSRLYRAAAEGKLVTFKAGRLRRVSRKALEDYVSRLERESAGRAA
jgi:excisionase family DNA binding protein